MATAEHIARRKQVLSFIEAFPQFHNQDTYFCGTKACIAGTAIMFDRLKDQGELISCFQEGRATEETFEMNEGSFFLERDMAARLLGLNDHDADNLFYCWDDAQAVEILRQLANEEPSNA